MIIMITVHVSAFLPSFSSQLPHAMTEIFVWWVGQQTMKEHSRSARTISGQGLCVMTSGTALMQQWRADSWDSGRTVCGECSV